MRVVGAVVRGRARCASGCAVPSPWVRRAVARGWNVDRLWFFCVLVRGVSSWWRGRGCGVGGGQGSRGTLLGPEATPALVGVSWWACWSSYPLVVLLCGVLGVGGGALVGSGGCLRTAQWTRASLVFVLWSCALKFFVAHGGCLGTRSRGRT